MSDVQKKKGFWKQSTSTHDFFSGQIQPFILSSFFSSLLPIASRIL